MSNIREIKAEEALQEYLMAVKNYDRIHDKYFPIREVIPGEPVKLGEPITEAVLQELEEAETRVSKALKNWHRLLGL